MNEEKKKAMLALKTVRGQVDGIINMIESERYCMDISNQIAASSALLKRAQLLILKQHIAHCVKDAVEQMDREDKLDEVMKILEKVIK